MKAITLHIENIEKDCAEIAYSIWGTMYLQIGDQCFPDKNWTDCVSSILDMWALGLRSYIRGKEKSCELPFMDGPYEVRLTTLADNQVLCTCFGGFDEQEIAGCQVSFTEFLDAYLLALSGFISACESEIPDAMKKKYLHNLKKDYLDLQKERETLV